ADAIQSLDAKTPKWRFELPLSANDEVIENLLGLLLQRAVTLERSRRLRLAWRGVLIPTGTQFAVEKQLECPDQLSREEIHGWINVTPALSPRLRLILRTPRGDESVARLTQIKGGVDSPADQILFRREWLRRGGVTLSGSALTEPHQLWLHDGQQEYRLVAKGEPCWSADLPWVFIPHAATAGRMKWLTEGSAKTKSLEAWVVVQETTHPLPLDAEDRRLCGELPELGRKIYHVTKNTDFGVTDSSEVFRVTCGADSESEFEYTVSGNPVLHALNDTPLYRGMPHLVTRNGAGAVIDVPGSVRQWQPVGIGTEWSRQAPAAWGYFWLRRVDKDSGVVYCRRQVIAVPPEFAVTRMINANAAGHYQLTGLAGATVEVVEPLEATVERINGNECRILCPVMSAGHTLPTLRLRVSWPLMRPLELALAYPQRGASLRLAGRTLQANEKVPLERLGGLRLLVQDPAGGAAYWLRATLVTEGMNRPQRSFREKLPLLADGILETGFYTWQDRMASLLASTTKLDAHVRLDIETTQEKVLTHIQVARFDVALEPGDDRRQVSITPQDIARLEEGWEHRVSMQMIRLWNPSEPPVDLSPHADMPATWTVPPQLEPGPWWVIGRDGLWARFRPLLLTVAGHAVDIQPALDEADTLASAIRTANRDQREAALSAVLTRMGESSGHPDWPLLSAYFALTQEFPPSSLDVLNRLITHPATLAMALLQAADDECFDRVWNMAEVMPFSWGLIPVRLWKQVALSRYQHLREALAAIDSGEDIVFSLFEAFRQRTTSRRGYWSSLCDWLQEAVFPERGFPAGHLLSLARLAPDQLNDWLQPNEMDLQGRHGSGTHWQQGTQVMATINALNPRDYPWCNRFHHLGEPHRPVRYAPFLAAHISLSELPLTASLIYELRLLRQFDPEWFDAVYAIQLTLGLTQAH
ncbi:MAG: STY4851/ECs_5259 family protein, partial [Methylococcaceae bacterium]